MHFRNLKKFVIGQGNIFSGGGVTVIMVQLVLVVLSWKVIQEIDRYALPTYWKLVAKLDATNTLICYPETNWREVWLLDMSKYFTISLAHSLLYWTFVRFVIHWHNPVIHHNADFRYFITVIFVLYAYSIKACHLKMW